METHVGGDAPPSDSGEIDRARSDSDGASVVPD